jgi:23S rRNA pseudouridine1911/1915/1917 synthase
LFRAHRIERRYAALVAASPEPARGVIDLPLRDEWRRGTRCVAKPGEPSRPALTRWRVVERLGTAALLEVELETGRQHQIRAHLAAAGLPILGDGVYGRDAVDPGAFRDPRSRRPLLHAARLAFEHPLTGDRIDVRSPIPGDFAEALGRLRRLRRASRGAAPP